MTGEIIVALQAPAGNGSFLHAQSRNGRRGVQPSFKDFLQAHNTLEQGKKQPLSFKDSLQGLNTKNGDSGHSNWARNGANEWGPAATQPLQNSGTRANRRSLCHPYQTGLRLLHAPGTGRKPRPGESNGLSGEADLAGFGQREQERILGWGKSVLWTWGDS